MTNIPTEQLRIGTIAILVNNRDQVDTLNALISQYQHMIIGRVGVPYRAKHVSIIALLVEGSTDQMGAFSGKLGTIPGVKIRSSVF